jgi:hypothetical protein
MYPERGGGGRFGGPFTGNADFLDRLIFLYSMLNFDSFMIAFQPPRTKGKRRSRRLASLSSCSFQRAVSSNGHSQYYFS